MASSMAKRERKELSLRELPDSVVLTILRMLEPKDRLRAIEALRLRPLLREELDLWPVHPLDFTNRPELSECRSTIEEAPPQIDCLFVRVIVKGFRVFRIQTAEVVFHSNPLLGPMEELGRVRLCGFSPKCVSIRLLPRTKAFEKAMEAEIEAFNRQHNCYIGHYECRVVRLRNFALQAK